MPDFACEIAAGGPGRLTVAGIDEAGRGPLAGPVVAAAVILDRDRLPDDLAAGIDDSKKLSPARRAALFATLRDLVQAGGAAIGVGAASVAEIDRMNVLQATCLAMRRAVARLPRRPDVALVDGNYAPSDLGCAVRTLVGGDGRSLSIAAASIVAKTIRDRAMQRLARRYPGFGWESNVGYGASVHLEALVRLGPTPHHRLTFSPLRQRSLNL